MEMVGTRLDGKKMSMLADKVKASEDDLGEDNTIDKQPSKNDEFAISYEELNEAKERIRLLEVRIQLLESQTSTKYPEVAFLNYKNRKRILVSSKQPESKINLTI